MEELSEFYEAYSTKSLRQKLKDSLSKHLTFVKLNYHKNEISSKNLKMARNHE